MGIGFLSITLSYGSRIWRRTISDSDSLSIVVTSGDIVSSYVMARAQDATSTSISAS
ncbi:hypothetical protein GCM10023157_32680 [Gluconacetobacter asukensis]